MSQLFRLKNGTVLLSTEAPGGIYNSGQLKKIAELCSKELAIVKATEDQRLALFVKESELENVASQLRAMGLGFRHYQDSLHQPISCLGELCEEHEQPAMATAMELTQEIAKLQIEAPLKIGINGCARCCTPCHTLDIAVVGDAQGYRISLGGKTKQMPEFASFFAEAVPAAELPKKIRAVIEEYQKVAEDKETLHDVIERCGVSAFVQALAPYSQDAAHRQDPFAGKEEEDSLDASMDAEPMHHEDSLDEDSLSLDDEGLSLDAEPSELEEQAKASVSASPKLDDEMEALDVEPEAEFSLAEESDSLGEESLSLESESETLEDESLNLEMETLDEVELAPAVAKSEKKAPPPKLQEDDTIAIQDDELSDLEEIPIDRDQEQDLTDVVNVDEGLSELEDIPTSAKAEEDETVVEELLADEEDLTALDEEFEDDVVSQDQDKAHQLTLAESPGPVEEEDPLSLEGDELELDEGLDTESELSLEEDGVHSQQAIEDVDHEERALESIAEDDIDLEEELPEISFEGHSEEGTTELALDDEIQEIEGSEDIDLAPEQEEASSLDEVSELEEVDDFDADVAEETQELEVSQHDEDLDGLPELDDEISQEPLSLSPPPATPVAAEFAEDDALDAPELSDEEENEFEQKLQSSIDEESRLLAHVEKDANIGARQAALTLLESEEPKSVSTAKAVEAVASLEDEPLDAIDETMEEFEEPSAAEPSSLAAYPRATKVKSGASSRAYRLQAVRYEGQELRVSFESGAYLDFNLSALGHGEERCFQLGEQTLSVTATEEGYILEVDGLRLFQPKNALSEAS